MKNDDRKAPGLNTMRDCQTACVAYANCPCALFGFWEATADKVGAIEATAFIGFTRDETDGWP